MGNPYSYTSSVARLASHPYHMANFVAGRVAPFHICVFPTTRCQLSCPHCLYRGRPKAIDLEWTDFTRLFELEYVHAVEFSGGGDPLLWPHFNEAVEACHKRSIKVGVCSNGLALDTVNPVAQGWITWLRLNLNALDADYGNWTNWASNVGDVSGSYVLSHQSVDCIERAMKWACDRDMVVRVVDDAIEGTTLAHRAAVKRFSGDNIVYVPHGGGKTDACYMAWWKPVLGWDGYIYPCPAIGYDPDAACGLPESMRLCHAKRFKTWTEDRVRDLGFRCEHCRYASHNSFLASLRTNAKHPDFV